MKNPKLIYFDKNLYEIKTEKIQATIQAVNKYNQDNPSKQLTLMDIQ
jgi:outer membrane protein OmpA-like peptidoglycan-associated protein